MPSHPDYQKINELTGLIAIALNPAYWRLEVDIEDWDYKDLLEVLEWQLEQELDGGLLRDFITEMEM